MKPGLKIPHSHIASPKCDACRYIALVVDANLRSADERLEDGDEELQEDEVSAIHQDICSLDNYRSVRLVRYENRERLRAPHIETAEAEHLVPTNHNWTERVGSHCRYLLDKMRGMELYELWLRAGHRNPVSWIEFMCEGEGVFGDCSEACAYKSQDWPWEAHAKHTQGRMEDNHVTYSSRSEYL